MKVSDFLKEYEHEVKVIQHLIRKGEGLDLNWRPKADMLSLGQVIFHLSDSFSETLQCLRTGNWPPMPAGGLPTLVQMKSVMSLADAHRAFEQDQIKTRDFLSTVPEQEFLTREVSVPWGEKGVFWRMAYTFIEHLKMHKMQLFIYLRLQGISVNTMDLYMGGQ